MAGEVTFAERDATIRRLLAAGCSERQIAKAIGMSNSGTHYLVAAIKGHPRRVVDLDCCDGCWEDFPRDQLVVGLCPDCRPDRG